MTAVASLQRVGSCSALGLRAAAHAFLYQLSRGEGPWSVSRTLVQLEGRALTKSLVSHGAQDLRQEAR